MLVLRRLWPSVQSSLSAQRHCSVKSMLDSLPILNDEVLHYLDPKNEQTILDMTFGSGLHSESILKASTNTKVIALDRDPYAYAKAKRLADKYPDRIFPLLGCFSDLPLLLHNLDITIDSFDGILLDVGCSDFQLSQDSRGFNSNVDSPLDMRMDCDRIPNSVTAADVLANCEEHDLHKIFRAYGGENLSRKLSKAVVSCRYQFRKLETTFDFRNLVNESVDGKGVAKHVFYALRAFVNNEINELNYGLILAQKFLKKGGHLVTLTYNQVEDLIVKRHLTGLTFESSPAPMNLKYYSHVLNLAPDEIEAWKKSPWAPLTKHVIMSEKWASSQRPVAKLRAAVKIN